MEGKKITLFIILLTLVLTFVTTVNAEGIGISEKGVKYDNNILGNFDNESFSYKIEGNKTSEEIIFIPVMVDILDTSNISLFNIDNQSILSNKISQRNSILSNITNSVLSTLSYDEFRLGGKEGGYWFYGNITQKGFNKLLNDPRVKKIHDNTIKGHISLAESAPLINADDAWNTLGYNGTGQTVCVIDTGVNYSHQDLGGCFGSGCKVVGGYDYYNTDSNPMDDNGHGTHVAGIVASEDSFFRGIAYGANIVALKVCDSGGDCSQSKTRLALKWCYDNRNIYNISVVSMSLGWSNGWGQCGEDFANEEINDLYNANIPVIAASGNNADDDQIDYPACNAQVISVGSTYDTNVGRVENCDIGLFWDTICLYGYCVDETTQTDQLSCFTNRGSLLDLLAPGCAISSTSIDGSFTGKCGTSMSTPMVAGAAALLLQKDPSLTPNNILTTLQDTGVQVDNWKRIDVEAALNDICKCTEQAGSCGGGSCGNEERQYIKTCDPAGCAQDECRPDAGCESGIEPKCEPTADCPSGYQDNGVTCSDSGEFLTCQRECFKDNYCANYGSWTQTFSTFSVDEDDEDIYKQDSKTLTSGSCWDIYSEAELYVNDWDPGWIWHYDAESVRVYTRDENGNIVSSCSMDQSSPESANTFNYLVTDYVGDNSVWDSHGKFIPYTDENCQGSTAWGLEGTLYVKTKYRQGTHYTGDTQYESCDIPYISSVSLDSPIYESADAECSVSAKKSISNIDQIYVKWYVNGDRVSSEICDDSGGDACDDISESTWGHTFYLDKSEFSEGDSVYCTAKVYGVDGGQSSTSQSSSVQVSNNIPIWSSITLNISSAKPGENIKVTADTEGDADSDILSMYCCNGASCTPSNSEHDFCYVTGDSYPYDLYCLGQGINGTGTQTIRCRVYDGNDYSTMQSDTYEVNITGGDTPPTIISSGPSDNQVDGDGNVTFFLSISDDKNIKNVTLYGNWSGGWHANETKILSGTSNSTSFNKVLSEGIYIWNFLVYDNSSQAVWSTNRTVNITIPAPTDNNPIVTLISPLDDSVVVDGSVTFNCSATDDYNLVNITLYHNISGTWQANQTKNISGTSNSTTFSINNIPNGNSFIWNCLAYDNKSQSDFGNSNWSLTINITQASQIGISLLYPTTDVSVTENKFFNFTTQICCYNANCNEINVSLDPESEKVTYTPTTKTYCKANKCTKTIYSRIKFVYEDNEWKKIENTKSLKNVWKLIKDEDPNFPVEVVDFNYTSIILDLGISEEKLGKDINLMVYNKNNKTEKPKDQFNKIKNKDKKIKLSDVNEKHREIIDLSNTAESILGQEIKWGENSTIIQLQEEDTENLDDSYIRDGASYSNNNYGSDPYMYIRNYSTSNKNILIRFNISSIPSYSQIDEAKLFLYLETNSLDEGESYNISSHQLYQSYSWDESSVAWNNGPSSSDFNSSASDSIYIFGGSGEPASEYTSWDVTQLIDSDLENVSFYLFAYYNNEGDSTDDLKFWSKEHPGSNDPYLNVTYGKMPKGLIPMTIGNDPFYTNVSNPYNITLNKDECINITWWINATGETNTTHTFFAFANKTSNMSINNKTNEINIIIVEGDRPPIVTLISPTNNYEDGDGIITFNCSATDSISLVNITLYGNWGTGWHANETKSLSGTFNSTTFTKNLTSGSYLWNCLAYDNASQGDWNNINWTINVSTSPNITSCKNLNAANKVYYLQNNISSDGTCLNITANNITIDGQGYTIFYAQTVNGKGIYNNGYNLTTIRNLSLVLNRTGLSGATYSYGINLIDGYEHNISDVNLKIAGQTSGTGQCHGILLDDVENSIIENISVNTSDTYRSYGIYIYADNANRKNNKISDSQIYVYGLNSRGIYLYGTDSGGISEVLIENSNIYSKLFHGIEIDSGTFGTGETDISNIVSISEGSGTYGIYLHSKSTLIRDSSISSLNSYDVRSNGGDHALLNVTYINESVSAGTLKRGWYLNVKVNETNGSNINQANVTGWNVSGAFAFSELTNSNGVIKTQELIEYINNAGAKTYSTNYTINVTKTNYENASQSANLTTNLNLVFTLKSTSLPNDTSKYYHKNSLGEVVAWLGTKGNIVLKGKCFSGGICDNPSDGSLIFKNDSDYNLGYINITGDLCIIKGDCSDQSANCNSPADGAFIMANLTNYVSYIDGEGDLCLVGRLYENADL